ncbi:class I SAM-dependent methyltransferase, partial [Sharpea azabuensis]
MKLHSKRLLAIAKAIAQHKQGTILADIGTDHAYLPCFLYDQGVIEKAYACDVAEGPLASSKQTIIANHMEGKIIPLLGNGLDPIVNEDVDMISICGMGGMLMIEILDAHNEMH